MGSKLSLQRLLEEVDKAGELTIQAEGKIYRVRLESQANPDIEGSIFSGIEPVPVNMTSLELADLIAEMRGE